MKKIVVIFGISILLIWMFATTAVVFQKTVTAKQLLSKDCKTLSTIDDPPDWATGNFTGVWGFNILGQPFRPLGWVGGYYSDIFCIKFAGVFAEFEDQQPTGYLGGYIIGPFMLGIVGNITTEEETYFVGIGGYNETSSEFYWRIIGIVGPSFYMYGTYTRFSS
jgi:hypothetical protein